MAQIGADFADELEPAQGAKGRDQLRIVSARGSEQLAVKVVDLRTIVPGDLGSRLLSCAVLLDGHHAAET